MNIRSVGAELLPADGRTDRHDKTNSRLSQFCKRAKNPSILFTRAVDVLRCSPTINPCKQCNMLFFVMDMYHVCCAVRIDYLCTGVKGDSDNRPNHPSGLSSLRPGFEPRSFLFSWVVGRMTLGQVFLRLLPFYPIIPPLPQYNIPISRRSSGRNLAVKWSRVLLRSTGLPFILGWHCWGDTQTTHGTACYSCSCTSINVKLLHIDEHNYVNLHAVHIDNQNFFAWETHWSASPSSVNM